MGLAVTTHTMQEIELIIFDLDGTLVDSRLDIVISVNYMLGKMGFEKKSYGEIVNYIGRGVRELIRDSLGEGGGNRADEGFSLFKEHYTKHFLDNTYLFPNVRETLEHFNNKNKIIITNKNKDMTLATLKGLGIDNFFSAIIGGDNVNHLKPAPDNILKSLKNFGVQPDKTIMVGDMCIDVQTGKNAKVTTCAVTYGIGKKEDFIRCNSDYIIDDMLELTKIVK